MFTKLKSKSKQIDMFGCKPEFFIDNQTKYKTNFGAFLTFLLFCSVVGGCYIYGKDMYYKQNPQYIMTEESTQMPEYFKIDKNTMNFAFGLQNTKNVHYFDETVYNVTFTQRIMAVSTDENGNSNVDTQYIDLNARLCTKDDFGVVSDYFTSLAWLGTLHCVDNYDLTYIEGDFGTEKLGMVEGQVQPCKNGTDIICKPQEEIDTMINDNYWALYVSDSVLNPKDFDNPFQSVGRNVYGFSSGQMFRKIDYNFRNIFLEDNSGVIFDSWRQKRGIQFQNYYEMTKTEPQVDGTFIKFSIRHEKVKQTRVYRTYLNFAEVAAKVGGILKVFTLIFSFLAMKYSQVFMNINLVNTLFNFEDSNQPKPDLDITNANENSNEINRYSKNVYDKNLKQKSPSEDKLKKQQDSNDYRLKKSITNAIKKTNQKFRINSFLKFINPFHFFKDHQQKEQNQKLEFAIKKMGYHLNIKHILQKLVEVDKLKMLLLDKNQMNLFEYQSKPLITNCQINQDKESSQIPLINVEEYLNNQQIKDQEFNQNTVNQFNILMQDQRSEQQAFLDAFLAFKQIMSKNKRQKVDDRILQTMDQNLKQQFYKFLQISLETSKNYEQIQSNQDKYIQNDEQNQLHLSINHTPSIIEATEKTQVSYRVQQSGSKQPNQISQSIFYNQQMRDKSITQQNESYNAQKTFTLQNNDNSLKSDVFKQMSYLQCDENSLKLSLNVLKKQSLIGNKTFRNYTKIEQKQNQTGQNELSHQKQQIQQSNDENIENNYVDFQDFEKIQIQKEVPQQDDGQNNYFIALPISRPHNQLLASHTLSPSNNISINNNDISKNDSLDQSKNELKKMNYEY